MKPLKKLLQLTEHQTDCLHHMFTANHSEYVEYEIFCEWIKTLKVKSHRSVTNSTISLYFDNDDDKDLFLTVLHEHSQTIQSDYFEPFTKIELGLVIDDILDRMESTTLGGIYCGYL